MVISLIVAMDEERGIGRGGVIPWHLRADLKRFKKLTMGHHLVMGRKTYQAIDRPLPGRTMIVITRNKLYNPEGCLVVHSLEDSLDLAGVRGETEIFIAGGGEIFIQALPFAYRIYLTKVHTNAACDAFFPEFSLDDWVEKERLSLSADEENDFPSTYLMLERVNIELE
jgi:dihydrofolate reductase